MNIRRAIFAIALALGVSGSAGATNVTSYYLFDGDNKTAWEISKGAIVKTFTTSYYGYAPAIRDSIWLGNRDDANALEYELGDGVATGRKSEGGNNFTQVLDGATGTNGKNYGVECCGSTLPVPGTNSVTVANSDWSDQTALFNIRDDGGGITYDPRDNTLFVSYFDNTIDHFDLTGKLLDTLLLDRTLVGLAYEEVSDLFWGWDRDAGNLVQFDRLGEIHQDLHIVGIDGNPFGGEMAIRGRPASVRVPVPEPGTLPLFGFALLAGLAASRRRR